MISSLQRIQDEFEELERALADPALLADTSRYREVSQRYGDLRPIVEVARRYRALLTSIEQARELEDDPEFTDVAREELARLEPEREAVEAELRTLLMPRDPYDDKDVIIEIRAAAGGDEASLFARELLEAYRRYAERHGFTVDLLDSSSTEVGGLSKVSFEVHGRGAYAFYKFESGVHRVQRVPETETQGRIHTSTVTVAVLPKAEDVDVDLSPSDYRVDVFRASGPGGQSVNTTDSAVRITYAPGTDDEIVVTCQDGKSQHKNKEKALTVLRARLLERERVRAQREAREARLVQIGTGDRSEKVRTYNVPQSRVTDHRIGFTTHNLQQVLAGDLDEVIEALAAEERAERLARTAANDRSPVVGAGGSA
ncbi:MAG: peptide chain release factor 1 [Trueperaceae bacterium]|nr:peptide chain release factor 1 [Trueperaceae bacterium]